MGFTIAEFESIYHRCFPRAIGLAVSMLHSYEDAHDTVQQVFVSLWESGLTIDNPDAFVYKAVRNACINRIEAVSNRERIKRLYALDLQILDDGLDQRIEEVKEAITMLTEREQQVVEQVFAHGKSYKEAATALHVSVSSINKHIVNALKSLRFHFKTDKS